MAASLILVNSDHRLRGCMAHLADTLNVTLVEPEGEDLPALECWLDLIRLHPSAPVVIDLSTSPEQAWALCRAARAIEGGAQRSVLFTCHDRLCAPALATQTAMLYHAAIAAPDDQYGYGPLVERITAALARAA